MFKLSRRSLTRLKGVHQDLVEVVHGAIQITEIDFTVIEGLRSPERQARLKASGASWTLNSRHITGHAVDVVPLFDGEVSYHWPHYYPLAAAMAQAAIDAEVPIEWGGCWCRIDDTNKPTAARMQRLLDNYVADRRAAGRKARLDGAHFQLPRRLYSAMRAT